jgi:hypothetical protein
MLIANPIYDSVFKYLLENAEVAREFLATMLDEEIVSIEIKPQETATESADYGINIFRLDFKAVIKMGAGEHRKVLIELQKAKHLLDIMRFRRYLADNYQEEDAPGLNDGAVRNMPLPIVTIYLLGFKLAAGYPAVFKLEHQVTDALTGKVISPRPREPFVELLNHESYTVQIPLLTEDAMTRLEKVLMVFNQEYRTDDPHVLNFTGDLSDPLVKKMVDRLARAISDPQVRREMDAEDEVDRTITRLLHEKELEYQAALQEKDAALQEKDAALQEKDAALQEKDAALQEKDAALQEKDAALQQRARRIAELEKQLADKQE